MPHSCHKNLRMLKKVVQQGTVSEEVRRTLRCAEPLSDVRTPLADFFSVRLDFLVFEKACEIGALEFERFGGLGLIALGPFHGSCDNVAAVFFHGFMVRQVEIGL